MHAWSGRCRSVDFVIANVGESFRATWVRGNSGRVEPQKDVALAISRISAPEDMEHDSRRSVVVFVVVQDHGEPLMFVLADRDACLSRNGPAGIHHRNQLL
jgi:hypothetical protein